MKLKIGTVEKEKKEEPKKDYFSKLSDNELESIQNEVDESVKDEVLKITSEEEEELEEAVYDGILFDKVGIHTKYVNKFAELYPTKNIVYQNYITKQFLEWYIKNAKISLLKELVIDSEFIKETQQEEIGQLANNRSLDISSNQPTAQTIVQNLQKEIEIEIEEPMGIELEDEQDIQMYEFLLAEKWKDRAVGITELDALIEEQMRTAECGLQQALCNLTNIFKLDKFQKGTKKLIERFHHVKFLYNLLSDDRIEINGEFTNEEIKQITIIKGLIEDRIEIKQPKQEKTNKQEKIQKKEEKDFLESLIDEVDI